MIFDENTAFKLKSLKIDISVTRIANVHYFEFTKNYRTEKSAHPFKELIYVDSGAVDVSSNGFCGTLKKRQLLMHKENEIHSLTCAENSAPNVVIIGFECDSALLDYFSHNAYTLTSELSKLLSDVVKEGRYVFFPPYDVPNTKDMKKRTNFIFGADQMLKIRLEAFLIELIRSTQSYTGRHKEIYHEQNYEEIASYINNNFSHKITLSDLCQVFGTNKTTLCQKFRNIYGMTIINYINTLRIKQAKILLREGNISITQIATLVGFDSVHYFSKTFKKIEGKSPLEYINTIKSHLDEI